MSLPNDVVGEPLPASIGPLDTTLTIQSFEREWTTVSYKTNVVHVDASASGSNREGGIVRVQFSVTEDDWRRLNAAVSGRWSA